MIKLILAVLSMALSITFMPVKSEPEKNINTEVITSKSDFEDNNETKESAKEYTKELTDENVETVETDSEIITVKCVDSSGNSVSGVSLSVCTDTMCYEIETDKEGNAVIDRTEDNYSVHITNWPEGLTPGQKNYEIKSGDTQLIINFL